MTRPVPTATLPSGESVPALGQGTWRMGAAGRRAEEVAALRLGIDLGMTLIDTAEYYDEAEDAVGEAVRGLRDRVFLVSKVMPSNASRKGTVAACERSLRRMGVETIDLYLLHWRGSHPLADTVAAFEDLREAGKIRHWGVSNLDADDMEELRSLPHGRACATNQVLYNLARRGIEHDLLPQARAAGMPLMAYSPIDEGRLLGHPELERIGRAHGATAAQVALAFVLSREGVIAIPKSGREAHVRDNRAALDLVLAPEDRAALDRAFPPPDGPVPLEMI